MPRFFINKNDINQGESLINIRGESYNHIKNVLRMGVGENLILCDGEGIDYNVRITAFGSDYVITQIISYSNSLTEPATNICLYQGLPKGDKMEQIIQKCVELGINRIVPVICKRSIVKIGNQKDIENKLLRWNKISLEASKQCNRGIIPAVSNPVHFEAAILDSQNYKLRLIPYEEEKNITIKSILEKNNHPVSTAFFIGPEGGFEPSEAEFAAQNGLIKVTLGKRILRTETAGPSVLSILRYVYGD